MRMTNRSTDDQPGHAIRVSRYAVVATLGFVVQFATLAAWMALGLPPVAATVLAIEAAILHNFAWHDRWTWGDRELPPNARRLRRLAHYNATMAVTSIGAGIAAAVVLVEWMGRSVVEANLVAIAAATLLNYLASDLAIFRGRRPDAGP